MAVRYYLDDVDARQLYKRLGTGRDGTRQNAIVKALRGFGLGANVRYDVGFERLRREIELGKLVIGYLHDTEHWVLLYGYGLDPARVFVADPEPGEPCVHLWERYVERLQSFGIVCSSRRQLGARARILLPPPAPPPRQRPEPIWAQLSFAFMGEES